MRVLLVQPTVTSEPAYPLALASMIPLLEGAGHTVQGIDLAFEPEQRIAEAIREGVDWVGATVLHHNAGGVARWMQPLKEHRSIQTFVAGSLPTLDPASALARTGAQFAVIGEPEETVADLIDTDRPNRVNGIAWNRHGQIHRNEPRAPSPLTMLPAPDRTVFPIERYSWAMRSTAMPYAQVFTSRGCRRHCPYCPVPTLRPRGFDPRSPEQIVDEWSTLVEEHGIRSIHVEDDSFLADPDRIRALCTHIHRTGLDVGWELLNGVRPDQIVGSDLDPNLLSRMADAGCRRIVYSFEHITAETTPAVGQSWDVAQAAVEKARAAGIRVGGYFILGLPGVDLESTVRCVAFALRLRLDDANFVPFYEAPGSAFSGVATAMNATTLSHSVTTRLCRSAQFLFFGDPQALSRLTREVVESPKTFPALAKKAWELIAQGGPIPMRDNP